MEPAGRGRVERRLAAIFAADVAGYLRLIGADESGTLRRLKAIRDELIDPTIAALGNIRLPTRVVRGERTAPALHRCADILSRAMGNASLHTIAGAGHFVTATHATELAEHIGDHVMKTESLAWSSLSFASPFGTKPRTSP